MVESCDGVTPGLGVYSKPPMFGISLISLYILIIINHNLCFNKTKKNVEKVISNITTPKIF